MHQTVFLGFAVLSALGTTLILGRARGLYLPHLMTVLALVMGGALAGTALFSIVMFGKIAAVSFGAIAGGGLLAFVTVPYFFERRADAYDVIVTAAVIGLLVSRVGCHFNGCDLGAPTDFFWGVAPGADTLFRVHPFPWMIVVPSAVVVTISWLVHREPGQTALLVAGGYLFIRFTAEFFRDDALWSHVFGLNVNQGFALAALVGLGLLRHRFKNDSA